MSGRLVIIQPDGQRRTEVYTSKRPILDRLNEAVNGYIEGVRVTFEGKVREAYVNEEGLLRGLPKNNHAMAMLYGMYQGAYIVGNLCIVVPDAQPKKK